LLGHILGLESAGVADHNQQLSAHVVRSSEGQ
jgi:hypothetical protein